MALLYNNQYYKITNLQIDYTTNISTVGVLVYNTCSDRELEKEYTPMIDSFIVAAHSNLKELSDQICNFIEQFNLNTDDLIESAKLERDEFNTLYQTYETRSEELHQIEHTLLKNQINISDLKCFDFWKSIGLTDDMLIKINIDNYLNYRFDEIPNDLSLETIYNMLKLRLVGSEDC